jgi:tRNA (guanine-N7-)-methyltransferase
MARSSNPFQAAFRPAVLHAPGRPPVQLEYAGPPLDLDSAFGRSGPLLLEIGPGRGDFLLANAAARPRWRLLGLEMSRTRALSLGRKLLRRGLGNVLVLNAVAELALSGLLPAATARELHIHFPDPWPKKRHRKRRLLGAAGARRLIEALAPGGLLCFMTDHEEYALEALGCIEALGLLRNLAGPGRFAARPDEPLSYYQELCLDEGRPIHYVRMQRPDPAAAARGDAATIDLARF